MKVGASVAQMKGSLMEVQHRSSPDWLGGVGRSYTKPTTPSVEKRVDDAQQSAATSESTVDITKSTELNQKFQETGDMRPEVVLLGKKLAAQSSYPPPETIHRIGALLSGNIES